MFNLIHRTPKGPPGLRVFCIIFQSPSGVGVVGLPTATGDVYKRQSDRAFAGADTLATAYTLSMGIKKLGEYDIILCGKMCIRDSKYRIVILPDLFLRFP